MSNIAQDQNKSMTAWLSSRKMLTAFALAAALVGSSGIAARHFLDSTSEEFSIPLQRYVGREYNLVVLEITDSEKIEKIVGIPGELLRFQVAENIYDAVYPIGGLLLAGSLGLGVAAYRRKNDSPQLGK